QNAARYTPPGGHLAIGAHRDGDDVVIAVRDDGRGIPPEMLSTVFELFTQVPGGSSGGLGIGLSLVRLLVELHGRRVHALSEGEDRGSEIVVRMPASAADAPVASPAPELGSIAHRVLVVDDNREAASSVGTLLEHLGAEVELAFDGPSALARLDAFDPTVILLD